MFVRSNHGRMISVFFRIQIYIKDAGPAGGGGLSLHLEAVQGKIRRALSIYKLAGVIQGNFHKKDVYQESNRTDAVLLFHFGMRFCPQLPLRAASAKPEFIYHSSGNFGTISCLPSIQKQTPNPANLTAKEQLL